MSNMLANYIKSLLTNHYHPFLDFITIVNKPRVKHGATFEKYGLLHTLIDLNEISVIAFEMNL